MVMMNLMNNFKETSTDFYHFLKDFFVKLILCLFFICIGIYISEKYYLFHIYDKDTVEESLTLNSNGIMHIYTTLENGEMKLEGAVPYKKGTKIVYSFKPLKD